MEAVPWYWQMALFTAVIMTAISGAEYLAHTLETRRKR